MIIIQMYMSAAGSHLKKLDLDLEYTLKIIRKRRMLTHWINLKGHCSSHLAKVLLENCWSSIKLITEN